MNYLCPPGQRPATRSVAFLKGLGYTYQKLSRKIKMGISTGYFLNFNEQRDLFYKEDFR